MNADVVIVGGGPIGLATAIEARRRDLSVIVLERQVGDVDKACGEGLMPAGVEWLEKVGALPELGRDVSHRFDGIRYISESGSVVEGRLPEPGGLGVRRTALSRVLRDLARRLGARLIEGANVLSVIRSAEEAEVRTSETTLRAAIVVGADGLHSRVRGEAGLEVEGALQAVRFGMRRHFDVRPWSRFVEVYFESDAEAYVTPVGENCVGVAFLWGAKQRSNYEELLGLFPQLARRVAGAAASSAVRGAGPMLQRVQRPVSTRLALVGDAAGYVDALTGEGLTLGFHCAEALGAALPEVVRHGGTTESLAAYEKAFRSAFDRYALLTHSLLAIARRPALRRGLLQALAWSPGIFEAVLCEAVARPAE